MHCMERSFELKKTGDVRGLSEAAGHFTTIERRWLKSYIKRSLYEFRCSFHNRSKFGLGIPDWVNDFFAHENDGIAACIFPGAADSLHERYGQSANLKNLNPCRGESDDCLPRGSHRSRQLACLARHIVRECEDDVPACAQHERDPLY